MPRIPRGREPQVRPLTGVKRVGSTTSTNKAIAKVSDGLFKLAQAKGEAEIKSLTRSYVSNSYSEDLIAADTFIENLEIQGPKDGSGYTESIHNFLEERIEARKETAPTDEAYGLYSQKFAALRDRLLIKARDRESKLRILSARRDQKDNISRYTQRLMNNPDLDNAISFSRENESSIFAAAAAGEYTPIEALELVDKMKSGLAEGYLDGLESREQYSEMLSFLRTSVPENEFKDELSDNGFSADTLPVSDPNAFDALLSALPPGERARRTKRAIAGLKSLNKRNTDRDKSEINDLSAVYKEHGSVPVLSGEKNNLLERLDLNKAIKPKENMRIKDSLNMSQAYGDARKSMSGKPIGLITEANIKKEFRSEMIKHRSALAKSMNSLIDKGHNQNDINEAANIFGSHSFNAKKLMETEKSLIESVKSDVTKLTNDGAAYYYNNNDKIRTYADAVMAPGVNPEGQGEAFERYARELDTRYSYSGVANGDRTYLTPAMSHSIGKYITQANPSDEGMNRLYRVADMFGNKQFQAFKEMAKKGDVPESMFALTQIDPTSRSHAETLFNIMRDEEGLKNITTEYDRRDAGQIDLAAEVNARLEPIRRVVQNADPSGRSLHIKKGLFDLIRIGALQGVIKERQELTDAVDKWGDILLEPYKIAQGNRSIALTKWDTAKYHNDLENFLNRAANAGTMRRVLKQFEEKGISGSVGPEPLWIEQAAAINMPGEADDRLDKRLNSTEWVMNPTFDGLRLMHTDTGTKRPYLDMDGKKIEIPLSRLKEIVFDRILDQSPEELEEAEVNRILESKFGGAF